MANLIYRIFDHTILIIQGNYSRVGTSHFYLLRQILLMEVQTTLQQHKHVYKILIKTVLDYIC